MSVIRLVDCLCDADSSVSRRLKLRSLRGLVLHRRANPSAPFYLLSSLVSKTLTTRRHFEGLGEFGEIKHRKAPLFAQMLDSNEQQEHDPTSPARQGEKSSQD